MKKIILLFTILVISESYSQCDKITNQFDEMKNIRTISSPYKSNFSLLGGTIKKNYKVEVVKIIKEGVSSMFITFMGYGFNSLIGSEGLFIKLSNDEIIRLENNKIQSSYFSQGIYSYVSTIEINESNVDLFCNNDIVQFDMSINKFTTKEKDKDLKLLKDYVKCIYDLKY